MLRRPFPVINVKRLLRPKRSCNPFEKRLSSTGPRGGGRKFLVSLVGATVLGIGGSIAYDSYDPSFRKKINQNVPYAEDILNFLIGPSESGANESAKSSPSIQSISQNESLMKKKLERSKAQAEQESSKTVSSSPIMSSSSSLPPQPTSVPPPPLEIPTSSQPKSPVVEKSSEIKVTPASKSKESVKDEKPVGIVKPVPIVQESKDETKSTIEAHKSDISPVSQLSEQRSETAVEHEMVQQYKKIDELEADFEKKIDLIRDEYEKELIKQLKRQVAVYLDHLNDQLEVQKLELERMQILDQEDKILAIKDKYFSELSGALNKLHDIEGVLKAREKLDEEEIRARKLWLLCQSLKDSLKFNGLNEPKPLKDEITTMKKTVDGLSIQSPMTSSILNSIPNDAIVEGVHNEDSLIERFKKVDKLCKRVALIGDNGGSLGQYVLSYLQSVLIIDSVKIPEQELSGTMQVDPSKWDTFEILARVKHSLNQRNIEQALKYANQLRGAPRKVAKDWISDTRTHLEVRQAAELLQALAATITIRAVKCNFSCEKKTNRVNWLLENQ
ncbi:MICOS complex subunit MIC60-like isoform X2 [Panonychus citri]|uniref:MICOS complex subunit MIC60-like isoform X2 n=1 Tax=Panonychus citri TaxID=50023 RepID=UPI002307923E|nr:MICOS complex subunit MIC60-like isoform X2 [Panonychus citri]